MNLRSRRRRRFSTCPRSPASTKDSPSLFSRPARNPGAAGGVPGGGGGVARGGARGGWAHRHFERALEVALTIENPDLRARVTYDFARVLEAEGESAQAAVRFRQAYEAGRADGSRPSAVSELDA